MRDLRVWAVPELGGGKSTECAGGDYGAANLLDDSLLHGESNEVSGGLETQSVLSLVVW